MREGGRVERFVARVIVRSGFRRNDAVLQVAPSIVGPGCADAGELLCSSPKTALREDPIAERAVRDLSQHAGVTSVRWSIANEQDGWSR
jgi:hypothetical protein